MANYTKIIAFQSTSAVLGWEKLSICFCKQTTTSTNCNLHGFLYIFLEEAKSSFEAGRATEPGGAAHA